MKTPSTTPTQRDALFTAIAKKHLFIETLEQRGRDHLDFHDASVIGIRKALEAAYEAGRAAARGSGSPPPDTTNNSD